MDPDHKITRTTRYTPDFCLNGTRTVEVKGRLDSADRVVLAAFKEQYPEKNLSILLYIDNKLDKKSDKRYSEWCKERDIPFAFKEVPDEWLDSTD